MSKSTISRRSGSFTPETYTTPAATPFRPVDELRNRVRRFFDNPLTPFFDEPLLNELMEQRVVPFPAIDLAETTEDFTVTAELPGLTRDDVHLEFEKGLLMITGEKKTERREENAERRLHLLERSYGTFQRTIMLPSEVDDSKITAQFADGVLTIRLPKTQESKSRRREIAIGDYK